MFKAQTDIGVSDKLQLNISFEKGAISTGQQKYMGAWALRKDAILVKGQTWATLQSMCEILTDFEPLEISLIAHKIHSKQNTAKISLVLPFFCFQLRDSNPLRLREN